VITTVFQHYVLKSGGDHENPAGSLRQPGQPGQPGQPRRSRTTRQPPATGRSRWSRRLRLGAAAL